MKTINYPKSLVEVWHWKELVYEKTKNSKDIIQQMEIDAKPIIERLGLKKANQINNTYVTR